MKKRFVLSLLAAAIFAVVTASVISGAGAVSDGDSADVGQSGNGGIASIIEYINENIFSQKRTVSDVFPAGDGIRGAASGGSDPTPTIWKGNNARTGFTERSGPKTDNILFRMQHEGSGSGIPLIDGSPVTDGNGNVFYTVWTGGMSAGSDALFSRNLETGEENWNNTDIMSRSSPTYFDGKIYVGDLGGCLYCVNSTTGSTVWTTPALCPYSFVGLTSSPLVIKDKDDRTLIYVIGVTNTNNVKSNNLFVFEDKGTTYEQICRIPTENAEAGQYGGAGIYTSVTADPDNGYIYVGGGSGGVMAFDCETMEPVWSFDAGAYGYSVSPNVFAGTPVYRNGSVFFAKKGALYCIDAADGTEIWHVTNNNITPSTPVVTETQVIAAGYTTSSRGIAGYSLTDGSLLWHYDTGDVGKASPAAAGNIVYYGTYNDATLYAVDITKTDGSEADLVWSYQADSAGPSGWLPLIEGTPLIFGNTLYIGAENGFFYGFRDESVTVTSSVSGNGTITPEGDVSVAFGESQTFEIEADEGHHIKDVLVDDVSVGAVASYTFENVTEAHTITAEFAEDLSPVEVFLTVSIKGAPGTASDGSVMFRRSVSVSDIDHDEKY
ncbi:MAG: PQQ-binding-like beta-propeller repeat protein, partial [Methanosarcinaceae archaeon]|nr:PQQ-binding-like beta-propeller repeat protein [Methanosarcinaceae archaeon]